MPDRGQMNLAAYYNPTGHHVASWRHPKAQADANENFEHYVEIAQTAERAKFDLLFLADSNSVRPAHIDALCRSVQFIAHFEPLTLLSALAAVTSHIGLVGTASSSWNEPYHIARKFASLDHLSSGRAGWNVVTSGNDSDAQNFSGERAYDHADRYERAHEVVDIVKGLWDSWDDDAFIRDNESGLYFIPEKMHELNYQSKRYSIRGPLNISRPPQGHPVIIQAGASDAGKELAGRTAEAIFSPHLTKEAAKEYYDDVKSRMIKHRRDPEHCRILPGISIFVKPTETEAREDFEYLQSLIHPIVAREILGTMLGVDLSGYDIDKPLPADLPEHWGGNKGHYEELTKKGREENLTIKELGAHVAGARGKNVFVGDPVQVADYMEDWFLGRACDGFTIMPPYLPGCLNDFVDLVLPELRKRGLFRTEYTGKTLRENLGLTRPKSRYDINPN